RGDIVLRRARGRVLVKNTSVGVWQITRESLWYANSLYLADSRDYNQLPERLRPLRDFQIDALSDDVLTTYAGLLLRDLLDRFRGDIVSAAGAYNAGVDHPNVSYAAGVETVASYARAVIQRPAALSHGTGQSASIEPHMIPIANDAAARTNV